MVETIVEANVGGLLVRSGGIWQVWGGLYGLVGEV